MPKFLSEAVALSAAGFLVFPLKPQQKSPAIKEWMQRATQDLATIETWWSARDFNIGIACRDVCIVIDVDTKDGRSGAASLKRLIAQGLPKTLTVRTPTGGLHLYYKHPGGFIKSSVNYWPGIDIRGNGGFVVAPGSAVNKGVYTAITDTPMVEWPAHLELPRKENKPVSNDLSDDLTDSLIIGGANEFSTLPDVVKIGERDDYLFRFACSMRQRGYAKDHATALMQVLHSRCEQPPGDEYPIDQALAKVDQAWTSYTPDSNSWTQIVTPQGPVVAPANEIKTMQEVLDRFIFSIDGNRVIDMNRKPMHAVMKLEEFKNAYKNVYINKKELPTRWLGNKNRQTVRGTTYFPDAGKIVDQEGEKFYNTYTPSSLELPAKYDKEKIKPFIDHVRYITGSDGEAKRFLQWCAMSVQRPDVRIPWMPVIITSPRCGKGSLFKVLQKIVGEHNTSKINPSHIEGGSQYNGWLSGRTMVCIEEIKTTRKWSFTEALKDLTSEDWLEINHKFGKQGQERIFANLLAFTNHTDAIAIDKTDGRFWVVNGNCVRRSAQYYKELNAWIESDGPAHVSAFLQQMSLSDFDWAEPPPMTAAKKLMVDESLSLIERDILDAIEDREGPFKADIVDAILIEDYVRSISQDNLTQKDKYMIRHLIQSLTSSLPQERYRVKLHSSGPGKRVRCRVVRNIEHWRKQDTDAIAEEYKRAWSAANGYTTPTTLKEVKNDNSV